MGKKMVDMVKLFWKEGVVYVLKKLFEEYEWFLDVMDKFIFIKERVRDTIKIFVGFVLAFGGGLWGIVVCVVVMMMDGLEYWEVLVCVR